jgi:hypothetical protein
MAILRHSPQELTMWTIHKTRGAQRVYVHAGGTWFHGFEGRNRILRSTSWSEAIANKAERQAWGESEKAAVLRFPSHQQWRRAQKVSGWVDFDRPLGRKEWGFPGRRYGVATCQKPLGRIADAGPLFLEPKYWYICSTDTTAFKLLSSRSVERSECFASSLVTCSRTDSP